MLPTVLHLSQPVDGGVAAVVAAIAADQRRRGWGVSVGCPDGGSLAAALAGAGVRRVRWDAANAKGAASPLQVGALRALLRRESPDVLHLHSASAGITGRIAVRGRLPTLFQPHGWSWLAVDGPLSAAALRWERWAQRWSTAVVCVSEGERVVGAQAGVSQRVAVVPNGVDLERFPHVPFAERSRVRAQLGLADVPTAVCVGRLDAQKGQEVLVRGWPQVRASVPDAALVLVGDGPGRQSLCRLSRALEVADAVHLVGARDDVPAWNAAADVLVLASRFGEGLPLTPMEAQATGRPVVVTDVVGIQETVGPGSGEVVPADDVGALATAVARRLADPELAAAEGLRAHAWARDRLDVRRSLDLLATLTLTAAARPAGAVRP